MKALVQKQYTKYVYTHVLMYASSYMANENRESKGRVGLSLKSICDFKQKYKEPLLAHKRLSFLTANIKIIK